MCAGSRAETKRREVIDNTWTKDEVGLSKSHVTDSPFLFFFQSFLSLLSFIISTSSDRFLFSYFFLFASTKLSPFEEVEGFDPGIAVTSCPFILPSHYLIESSPTAVASHY